MVAVKRSGFAAEQVGACDPAFVAHLSVPATTQQVSAAGVDFSRVARALKLGCHAEAGTFHDLRDVRCLQETDANVHGQAQAIAWTPDGAPVVIAILSRRGSANATSDDALIADVTKAALAAL